MTLCNFFFAIFFIKAAEDSIDKYLEKSCHPIAQRLHEIIRTKQTNICVAIDVDTSKELLSFADKLGPHVCCVKTHIDIISDFAIDTAQRLKQLAQKHNFLIMEDRKFCDIGAIVKRQYSDGLYKIARWADIITAHAITGEPMLETLESANPNCAILLIAQMSSKGSLLDNQYAQNVYALACKHRQSVIGFIAQGCIQNDRSWFYFAPGINQSSTSDGNGQQYRDIQTVLSAGINVVVIGRAICQASDPVQSVIAYKELAWQTYSQLSYNVGCVNTDD